MAPFLGPSREAVLKMLGGWWPKLPITLGRGGPQATISCVDGMWRLRPLVLDQEKCDAFGREQLARGENFMHEHTWRFLYEGEPLIESASKGEFLEALTTFNWIYG